MIECPHCGYHGRASVVTRTLGVTFNCADGTVTHTGKSIRLSPRRMDIFELIYDATPRGISLYDLHNALYADRCEADEPENWYQSMQVRLSELRRRLRPIGVTIQCRGQRARAVYILGVA
jgi:DNA-binding winged helix-turn-helix (wHTH) protein